jgi:hypothetical protein
MRFPLVRLLSVLLALAVVAAACTDDPESATTGDDGVDENVDGNAGENAEPDSDAAESERTDTATESDDSPDAPADPTDFCETSAAASSLADAFDPLSATAAEIEDFYRTLLSLVDEALVDIPAAVADAMAVQRRVTVETIDVLAANDWDYEPALDQLTPIYLADDYVAADRQLEAYDADVCGFEPEESEPTVEPPVEEPAEVPAEYVAYCNTAFEASQAEELGFDADAAEAEAFYTGLLDRLEQLLSLAPPELVDALSTIRGNSTEVVSIFVSVDWDLDAGFALVEERASDPAVSDEMDAAIDVVEAFDADVCGLFF